MKSYHIEKFGSIEGLTVREHDIPRPLLREVLVRVHANSLNGRDLAIVQGLRKFPPDVIPVTDAAGEVVELGPEVTRVALGERVAGVFHPDWMGGPRPLILRQDLCSVPGMLAEYVVLDEEALVKLPAHLSYEEGATLPCAALAAWNALGAAAVSPGDTVLLQGTGGVSVFALQFAKLFGARVIATSSAAHKLERLQRLGADAVLNYADHPDWGTEVRKLTGERGVDAVIEMACDMGNTLQCVRNGARISILSRLAAESPEVSFSAIVGRHISIFGVGTGSRSDLEAMNRAIALHRLRPVIDRVFAFEQAKEAYRYLASRQHFGKVVISQG